MMDEIMSEVMITACGMGTEEPSPCETPEQCRDGGCARLRARDVAQVAEVAAETRIRVLDAPAPRDPVAARRASLAIAAAFLETRPSPEQLLEFAEGYASQFADQMPEVAYLRGLLDSCVCGAGGEADVTRPRAGMVPTSVVTDEGGTDPRRDVAGGGGRDRDGEGHHVRLVADERIPKGSIVVATKNGDAVAFPFDVSENRTIAEPWSVTDRLRRIEPLLSKGVAEGSRAALADVRSILDGE